MTDQLAEVIVEMSDDEAASMRDAPTTSRQVLRWVDEIAALTTPDAIHWCNGSEAENSRLCQLLVGSGTFIATGPISPLLRRMQFGQPPKFMISIISNAHSSQEPRPNCGGLPSGFSADSQRLVERA